MAVTFKDITDVKRQPVQRGPEMPSMRPRSKGLGGFPVPMNKQMSQVQKGRKLKFPKLKKK